MASGGRGGRARGAARLAAAHVGRRLRPGHDGHVRHRAFRAGRRRVDPGVRAVIDRTVKPESAAVITGFGSSRIGRGLGRDPLLLTADAALAAIADAGLSPRRHRRRVDVPGRAGVDAGHHRGGRRRRARAAGPPDIDGVWGQLCFPNYARFAGHRFFLNVQDPDPALSGLRTYNDYLLDEWCATDPPRLYGAVILPLHDVGLAELERLLAKGARAIAFSENPPVLGLPSAHTGHGGRTWEDITELKTRQAVL